MSGGGGGGYGGAFGQGLAYAQAAEENERAGDAERALALYIHATESLFAAGSELEDLETKKVLEQKLPELIHKVEGLLARQHHHLAPPAASSPHPQPTSPQAAHQPPAPQPAASLLPKLPPPPSSSSNRAPSPSRPAQPDQPQHLRPHQQHHQQRLLSMSCSSDEDEFNPFPASPLLAPANDAVQRQQSALAAEAAQKRERARLAEALGRGWGQTVARPSAEDLLCGSPHMTAAAAADSPDFVDKAKESRSSPPSALDARGSGGGGGKVACPICGDEFVVAEIERHATACLDRMERRDKGRLGSGFLNPLPMIKRSLFFSSSSSSASAASSRPAPDELAKGGGWASGEGSSLLCGSSSSLECVDTFSSSTDSSTAASASSYPSLQALEPSEAQRYAGGGRSSRAASPRRPPSLSNKKTIGTVVEATSSNYATVTYLRQGIRRSAESMCDKSSVTYDDALAAHTYPLIEAISSSTSSSSSSSSSTTTTSAEASSPMTSASTSIGSSSSSTSVAGGGGVSTLSTGPEFVDHAPLVFHRLRAHFGVTASAYLASMGVGAVEGESFSTIVSPGKSGSHFYFSPDTRYVIKTINDEEFQFFRDNVFSYYEHMASNQNSLLTRFFALYTVRAKASTHHFVVMENLFPCDLPVHEAYDLKGSMAGRFASEQELMNKEIAVLKDINFQKNRKLVIGREKRQLFFRQLEMDCQWLESHGVMDYSLLLLIHKNSSSSPPSSSSSSLSSSLSSSSSLSPAASASSSAFSALSTLCAPTSATAAAPAKKPLYPSLFGGGGGGGQGLSPRESAKAESVFRVDRGGLASTDDFDEDQGEIYFMAIIDILQPYNWRKRLENTYKKLFEHEDAISCVDPIKYSNRFVSFIKFQTQGSAQKA